VHAGNLYNCTDANSLVSFDAQTLETSGREEHYAKFNSDIKGPLSAAHGQYDAARGEFVRRAQCPSYCPSHADGHTTDSRRVAERSLIA
jgi:hypothetical protein